MTKTIFISIFEGVEAKNILRTPILETLLKKSDIRIVLFTKNEERVRYYQEQFDDPRIVYEVVTRIPPRGFDALFSKLKFTLLRTKTTDLKRRMALDSSKNIFKYAGGVLLNRLLARPIVRRIVRKLDCSFVKDKRYDEYFKGYKPDLVFLAHLFDEPEIEILRAAKKHGVRSVGFVNSWDKGTARSIVRLLPDTFVVFNDIVKKEMIVHNEMKGEDIFVSGLPQYDIFKSHTPISREAFFKRYGFDTKKRLIVYAPMGRAFGNTDWEMIDLLTVMVKENKIENAELLVRFQPNDFLEEDELKKRPTLVYDYPGKRFSTKRGVDWDMDDKDLKHLADTLANASVIVSFASSISIDALAYDKQTVAINFEPKGNRRLQESPTQYYHTEHYENVLKTGGVVLADSEEQLVEKINHFLDHPEDNKDNRARLKREQWQFEDGKVGERIGAFLLRQIEK